MWIMEHGTLIDISFNKVSLINYKAITGVKFLLGDIAFKCITWNERF